MIFRHRAQATGSFKSKQEAEAKARARLEGRAAARQRTVKKPKVKSELVRTKGGVFHLATASGRFKKRKGKNKK
jgi:hypothetical protein